MSLGYPPTSLDILANPGPDAAFQVSDMGVFILGEERDVFKEKWSVLWRWVKIQAYDL